MRTLIVGERDLADAGNQLSRSAVFQHVGPRACRYRKFQLLGSVLAGQE